MGAETILFFVFYYLVTRAIATYILALEYKKSPRAREEIVGWTAACWFPFIGDIAMLIVYWVGLSDYLIPWVLKSLSGVDE